MNSREILKIYKEFKVPANIIAHMSKVASVANNLAKSLMKKGYKIDEKSITNAALLHDTLRVVDIQEENLEKLTRNQKTLGFWLKLKKKYQKIGHERAMAKILRKRGHYELALLISKHGFFDVDKLKTLEEKIVYYADKRVDHDKIVNLKKRFIEGKKRNLTGKEDLNKIAECEKKIYGVEKYLKSL